MRLPNFEDPRQPISTWRDKPTPQGFGAVDRWWQPRAAYAGTYDDTWKRTRMPVLPLDFDDRFFQAAPADLVHTPHLTGGEPVIAVNLSKRGTERFRIPRLRVTFAGVSEGRRVAVPGVLDTVICLFDSSRVAVVWRAKYRARINEPADPVTARVDNWD